MKVRNPRTRLDALLVARGLADSLPKAQAMILAGEVFVDGVRVSKSGTAIASEALVEVNSREQKYSSRGGFKLEGALRDFQVDPAGRVCLDIGSSTGGFTDCLLQHGAARVYAVDVTVDQIAWKLRQDVRVLRIERNARGLKPQDIPEAGRPGHRGCIFHLRRQGIAAGSRARKIRRRLFDSDQAAIRIAPRRNRPWRNCLRPGAA